MAESLLITADNAGDVVEAIRAGRLQVHGAELIRSASSMTPVVPLDGSTPAAMAGSIVRLLADRGNLGVQLQITRQPIASTARRVWEKAARHHSYRSVAEDIEWFQTEWLVRADNLSDAELRRGSTQLRLLLNEGLASKAWRDYGFDRQPMLDGPDIVALAARDNLRLDLAASVVAGGGRVNDVDMAFIGAFRIDNPTTGIKANAEEGFAVSVTAVTRDARRATPGELDALVNKPDYVDRYLSAPGAVRRGELISRRDIIEYFRNYMGGSHHDFATGKPHARNAKYELIAELEQMLRADVRDGLHFEILSIGQAVARSDDMRRLAARIRQDIASASNP